MPPYIHGITRAYSHAHIHMLLNTHIGMSHRPCQCGRFTRSHSQITPPRPHPHPHPHPRSHPCPHPHPHPHPQLWNSTDLKSFTYMHPITPGGPGGFWELPYLLPFHANGSAIDNYHHSAGQVYALLFGHGNAYWIGDYDSANKTFRPLGVTETPPQSEWPEYLPAVIGSWPLINGSGAATIGPTATLSDTRGVATGTEFYPDSLMTIPFFPALENPTANGGLAVTFLIQLNQRSSSEAGGYRSTGTVLARGDDVWGLQWWGERTLNFWVRGADRSFRAVQASVCEGDCGGEWVRVAMSYDVTKPFAEAIAMAAAGQMLKPTNADPGNHHGMASRYMLMQLYTTILSPKLDFYHPGVMANSTAGLRTFDLPGMALAEIKIFAGPLSVDQLKHVTAQAVPPPSPTPPPPPQPGPVGWPANNYSDSLDFYSFNPHGHDTHQGHTRRIMFGWVRGEVSAAVVAKKVPYWQSAHSLMREVTVSGASLVQMPAAGTFEPLRTSVTPVSFGPISIVAGGSGYLPGLSGDALEIVAVFNTQGVSAQAFGLTLRVSDETNSTCKVGYTPATKTLIAPGENSWGAAITPQPTPGTVSLHIFLDRSIVETYTGGAALTSRCLLPRGVTNSTGVDLWSVGGEVEMVSLNAWHMNTMWGQVTA